MEYPVVVIAGPTCTGKSATAVCLAEIIDGEVVSADSVQVYRGMDIGSAKIRASESRGVPHHLIDVADPSESLNVIRFREMAVEAVEDIRARGKVPIIAGGTGFYIDSILFESPGFGPGTDPEFRSALKARAENGELAILYSELQEADPQYAAAVHPNNSVRIIRALEYCHAAGSRYSEYALSANSRRIRFPFRCFVLDDDRRALYTRIDARVDSMMDEGFEAEVRRLMDSGAGRDSVAMQAVGYRQISDALSGSCSMSEAAESIKRETRHIAKRQLTWFRHTGYSEWLDVSQYGRDPHRVAGEIASRMDDIHLH